MRLGLRFGGSEIGQRRRPIASEVEVPGVENGIPAVEPCGSRAVQSHAPLAGDCLIRAIPEEGVRKQVIVARGPNQVLRDQIRTGIVVVSNHEAQGREGESLSEDRCCAQSVSIGLTKLIEPRLNNALDRPRHRVGLRASQQLLEEQRISGCPIDAPAGKVICGADISAGENMGIVIPKGSKIQGDQATPFRRSPPGVIDPVALEPRCHHQDDRPFDGRASDDGE